MWTLKPRSTSAPVPFPTRPPGAREPMPTSPIWQTARPDGESLPKTGSATTGLAAGGGVLVAVGAVLLFLLRRRGTVRG
jgi:LPXTG-motif cell wall-anchored protein